MFLKVFCKFHGKTSALEFIQTCNFIKKRVQGRYFPLEFAKSLRTAFLTGHHRWLLLTKNTAEKTTFSFFKFSEKIIFPKKLRWNTIFFPKNIILFFRQKMKGDLSERIHGNMAFSSNVLKRWSLQKNLAGIRSFLYIWKDDFFSRKIWYFFFWWKMKDDLSQEIHEDMIFSVYMYKCYKCSITLLQKNQRWSSPKKIQLKLTDSLDRILERIPTTLCTFMEPFIGVFKYYFPVKIIRKLKI